MYAEFFGLAELPFNITPDPRFLYLNDCYQEALAALAYGIEARKGFISLIGEAGTGKTTLLRRLLDTLNAGTKTVLLINPTVNFDEILEHILAELGIPTAGSGKLVQLRRLNEFLLDHTASGGNVVLMIDEAQDIRTETLEELRLLSNLETAREKILQIILAGQPELEGILRNPALRQLRQRITLHVRVRPLTPTDVRSYVRTRLEHAGAADLDIFTDDALARVAVLTRGIPRLVNVLCDASLLMGFVNGARPVTPTIVDAAWKDYSLEVEDPTMRAVDLDVAPARTEPAVAAVASPPPAPALVSPPPAPVVVTAPPAAVEVTTPAPPERPTAPDADSTVATIEAPVALAEQAAAPALPVVEPTPTPLVPDAAPAPAPVVASEPAASNGAPAAAPAARPAARELPFKPPRGTTAPSRWPASEAPRSTFSIPAAIALVAALVIGAYAVAVREDTIERLDPVVASVPVVEAPTPAESGTAVAATPPAPAAPPAGSPVVPTVAPASTPTPVAAPVTVHEVEVIRPDGTPITAAEANDLIDRFRAAYESRDVDRLLELFAADAVENGRRGREAIGASYRTALSNLIDVRYTLPNVAISAGPHAAVRAPFVINYRQRSGATGEVKGDAEWGLERRNGQVRIVALSYRLG